MSRETHPTRPVTAVAAYALLSAALALTLFAPSRINARDPARKHGATSGEVAVDGKLVQDKRVPSGWAIELTAVSQAATESPCNVEAKLMAIRDGGMSRVAPRPERIWQERVAMQVPAKGTAIRRIQLPAKLAADVAAADRATSRVVLDDVETRHVVRVDATCSSGPATQS